MADAQKTIDLIFNGVDKTGAATLAALDNAKKFSSGLQNTTQGISDFTIGAAKLEAGLLAAGLAITVFAVNEASKFEGALLDLKKVLNESDGPVEQFADAARVMANEFGVASTEVLQSVSNFKQAGFTAAEALTLTRNALDLKIAGDVEAARASELLISSLKGFNLEATEGTRIVDLLNEVSNQYATDVNELGEGFARLSPVAKAAGLSLEETAGILTPGIEVFRSGAEVANALRTVLLRLQDDSKPVRTALEELGVSQFNANGELRTARDIYFDVAKAFGPLSDAQKTYYANQLAGMDQSAKFIAVMGGVDKTLAISSKSFEYLGSAAKEVEIRLKSTEVQVSRMGTALNNMFIDIGTPMLDEFGGLANAIGRIFTELGVSVKTGGLKDLVTYIESQMQALQKSIEAVADNLPAALAKADFSGFKKGINSVVEAFKLLFSGIDLTTVDGLKAGIETMGAAFLGLSKYTAGVVESFKPLFDALVAVGKGAKDVDLSFLEVVGGLSGLVIQLNAAMPLFRVFIGLLAVNNGLGLVKQLASLGTILPSVVALIAGPAGFALALTALAYESYQAETAIMALIEAKAKLKASEEQGLAIQERAVSSLERFAETSGMAAKSIDEADKLIRDGAVVWSDATNGWVKAGGALADVAEAASSAQADFRKSEITLQNQATAAEKTATSTGKLANAQKEVAKYALETVPIYDKLTGAITGYEQKLVKSATGTLDLSKASASAAASLDAAAKATEKAKDAQAKWNEEVKRMAFEEKLKLIDSATKITTAQIEAMAKTSVAAFESLSVSIKSTGDVLGTLFKNLDFTKIGWDEQRLIEKQIDKENKLREDAFVLQKQLTEAQIRMMNAQADAMAKGEGMIKIDGAGLAPELEAFMWKILQTLQVRVNAQGLKLLLGV